MQVKGSFPKVLNLRSPGVDRGGERAEPGSGECSVGVLTQGQSQHVGFIPNGLVKKRPGDGSGDREGPTR